MNPLAVLRYEYLRKRMNGELISPRHFVAMRKDRFPPGQPDFAERLDRELNAILEWHRGLLERLLPFPECRLEKRLGSGGFGEVWQIFTGKKLCAVKIIASRQTIEIAALKRIFQTGVQHHSILSIEDYDTIGQSDEIGLFFYTMPLAHPSIEGDDDSRTLQQVIAKSAMKADVVFGIAIGISKALHHLHERKKLVHRDIKPANILYWGEHWVLGDLGLLTERDRPITGIGTRDYMPSSTNGFTSVQMDLYALGLTLAQCLTGKKAREVAAILMEERSHHSQVETNLWDIIRKACHPSGDMRFGSAKEMIDMLEGRTVTLTRAVAKEAVVEVSRADKPSPIRRIGRFVKSIFKKA